MIDLTGPLSTLAEEPEPLKYGAVLRAMGAELAVIAARRRLEVSLYMFHEDRATVQLRSGSRQVCIDIELAMPAPDRRLGTCEYVRPLLEAAADRLDGEP